MSKIMVALITPFTYQQTVDEAALRALIRRLLREGADGFIVCGTTGEAPTLRWEEKLRILALTLDEVQGQAEVWMGCGSNDTVATCERIRDLQAFSINGYLLVAPYYNRPSADGLYRHFAAAAHVSEKQIMLYNVPSRCGVTLTYPLLRRLFADFSNITALKQASGDLETIKRLRQEFSTHKLYSGEDAHWDEGLAAGMDGIISVMAHTNLPLMKRFLATKRSDVQLCEQLCHEAALHFLEPSPACVKYILSKRGECNNILRLPLCPISKTSAERLDHYYGF